MCDEKGEHGSSMCRERLHLTFFFFWEQVVISSGRSSLYRRILSSVCRSSPPRTTQRMLLILKRAKCVNVGAVISMRRSVDISDTHGRCGLVRLPNASSWNRRRCCPLKALMSCVAPRPLSSGVWLRRCPASRLRSLLTTFALVDGTIRIRDSHLKQSAFTATPCPWKKRSTRLSLRSRRPLI